MPSPLIIPGYNLPGPIFNNGQAFYVEKDPVTGQFDFNSKTSAGKSSAPYLNEYDYIDEEPSTNIFDKANIDRKDGGYGSHRPNDINQLTPNFHDFLNLPVKYNSDKYVYPLISSSYANTKVQGNVNSFNNHKYVVEKTTQKGTMRPTVSPTYYTTRQTVYYKPRDSTTVRTTTTTTTVRPTTTTIRLPTSSIKNLLNSAMNHPSYYTTEENEYDYEEETTKPTLASPSTTKRPYSIFDELFGDYEEPKPERVKPSLFGNMPSINFGEKIIPEEKSTTTTARTTTTTFAPSSTEPNTISEEEYEYGDYEEHDEKIKEITTSPPASTTTTTQKPEKVHHVFSNFHQNYRDPIESLFDTYETTEKSTKKPIIISITTEEPTTLPKIQTFTTAAPVPSTNRPISITEIPTSIRVTSLPLGENHPPGRLPIITIPSLKDQLNNEKVIEPTPNIKSDQIPQQSKETFTSNSFRPLYTPNKLPEQKLQPGGVVKETLTFTGTGQINSNYSWTVPQKNQNDNFPDEMPPTNVYKQEIHSNYSWTVPELPKTPPVVPPIAPPKALPKAPPKVPQNVVYPGQNYNLQQVGAGYSVGQSNGGYGQGSVFTVGTSYAGGSKYKPAYQYAHVGTNYNLSVFPEVSSSIKIQPVSGSEASLSIGSPAGSQKVPGQVMDEKLDLKDRKTEAEATKTKPGNKIIFPEDIPAKTMQQKEILSLYSKPMLHQLPSELTPPVSRPNSMRPPWDPRPGHFYQGRPEYARPPRPPKPEVYKRIDGLPNILPQFRPNAKIPTRDHHHDIPINQGYMQRQPLLDRPSNRPIGFFEKLHPPPPPPPKRILELRKPTNQHIQPERKQEKIESKHHFVYPTPPKVPIANRRNGDEDAEISTLQMLHAKQADKLNTLKPNVPPPFKVNFKETTDKPLYVVYPVNSSPLKLDTLDKDPRESVVIGTRSEQPLPPSKIGQDFPIFTEQKPILKPKDSPILKPQRPSPVFPIKTDFPYPLERPDPTVLSEKASENNLESTDPPGKLEWDLETQSRIINGNKIFNNEPISVTLKTYTQSPIAIAYTPTESPDEKYSMPNYGSAVISEIRHEKPVVPTGGKEITVSAVMHTRQNHKTETETEYPTKLEFQAPFHASVNIGSNNGWSVVRDRSKDIDRSDDENATDLPETSSKFDIENFKPQLFGGFKPIYDLPEEEKESSDINDREE